MSPDTAKHAYRRVKDWANRAQENLLQDLRSRGACDPIPLTLHNWGRCNGDEPYRTLDREFRYRQRKIWDTRERLSSHFARFF